MSSHSPKTGAWLLVTGGAGYVAGCLVRALLADGYGVTVLDDLSAGHADCLPSACELVIGRAGDRALLERLLARPGLEGVFHFAARTSVPESVSQPLVYYENNVVEGVALIGAVAALGRSVPFVLSSSAGVYGPPERIPVPVPETAPLGSPHAYGESKRILEGLLGRLEHSQGQPWAALRYFNAAGATAEVVERHTPEGHLIPNLLTAAAGGAAAKLFGQDYDTPDGTAVRDYVHVLDLADGHLRALRHLQRAGGGLAVNLGSGRGASVLEVLRAAEAATGRPVPHTWHGRRAGDPPVLVADITLAERVLGYRPAHSSIERIVADAWRHRGAYPTIGSIVPEVR
jgi:UDP-glucose 4-epimerase